MSLQSLPVMDLLYAGSSFMRPGLDRNTGATQMYSCRVSRDLFELFASFKRIKLHDADRMPSRHGVWDVRKEFGHLMLPFPKVWIEWNNTRGTGGEPDMWMAAMCVHSSAIADIYRTFLELDDSLIDQFGGDHRFADLRENSWIAFPFAIFGGRVMTPPVILIVDLDEEGVIEGVRGADPANALLRSPDGEDLSVTTAEAVDLLWDALVAVGWLNCRNVRTQVHDRAARRSGSKSNRRKTNARSLDFHTIHLPGVRYDSDGAPASDVETDVRLHQVRGHFKTFTIESPLMGQHVGTYWWGWQVRGNKKNGVVVSDYKVGSPS